MHDPSALFASVSFEMMPSPDQADFPVALIFIYALRQFFQITAAFGAVIQCMVHFFRDLIIVKLLQAVLLVSGLPAPFLSALFSGIRDNLLFILRRPAGRNPARSPVVVFLCLFFTEGFFEGLDLTVLFLRLLLQLF